MNACTVCAGPVESGDLCAGCAAKVKRVRPAGRFVVDRAARKALAVADRTIRTGAEGEGDVLADYTLSGVGAGWRW